MTKTKRIVFATTGSLGDVLPFIAVGQALRQTGHDVVIATTVAHQDIITAVGLTFHHMRPDPGNTAAFHQRFMDRRRSPRFIFKDYLSAAIRDSYDDLLQAVHGADLLISQTLALAAPLVAGRTGMPWLSAVFQPMTLYSLYEPPALPFLPFWRSTSDAALRYNRQIMTYARNFTWPWVRAVTHLKQDLALPVDQHPIYEGQHSPHTILAMFSPLFGTRQPDWPERVVQTGTALPQQEADSLPVNLQAFLDNGPSPLVFTLGSSSSNAPGRFYKDSLKIAEALGQRAVLMTAGLAADQDLSQPLPDWAMRVTYAPYGPVFRQAMAVVHGGGIAASMLAMQAGVPQILVPYAHDQIDNATRLERLGVAKRVKRHKYTVRHVAPLLQHMLHDAAVQHRIQAVAEQARAEKGVTAACAVIEKVLAHGV